MEVNNPNLALREKISALMDGECSGPELDELLILLKSPDHRHDWEVYHRIGDLLKSSEADVQPSADFMARFEARMAAEPTILRPVRKSSAYSLNHKMGYAVAAAVALVAILVPQFAGHEGAETTAPYYSGQFLNASSATKSPILAENAESATGRARMVNSSPNGKTTMLRDPLIDSYLAAHQRYSKSMYSAVEYETGPITPEAGK